MNSDRASEPSPPIACTLSTEERPDRVNAWTDVLARATEQESTATGIRLRFDPDSQLVSTIADLAVREAECCAFFTFTITVDSGGAWLAVDAPTEARPVLDALFA
jgi:hypothetical protein